MKNKLTKKEFKSFGVMTELSVLPFGKYKGDTVTEVMKKDPSYLCWLSDRTDLKVHPRVYKKAAKRVRAQPKPMWWNDQHWGDDEDWQDSPCAVFGEVGHVVGPLDY